MRFIEKETNPNLIDESGIYKISNISTGKIYIGSAKNFRVRYNDHLRKLRIGNHLNSYLQNAYNKNNQDLIFSIIEPVSDLNDLILLEQEYLDLFYDDQNNCYNMCPTAGSALGRKHSAKTREKIGLGNKGKVRSAEHTKNMSEIRRGSTYKHTHFKSGEENPMYGKSGQLHHLYGKKHSPESIEKMRVSHKGRHPQLDLCKRIAQYDLEGNFIKEFDSISGAIRETGVLGINRCLVGKRRKAGNCMWKYIEDKVLLKIDPVNNEKKKREDHTPKSIEKMRANHPSKRAVQQFSKDNPDILIATFVSVMEAERQTGVCNTVINRVCNGLRKSAGGYLWKYVSKN